MNKNAVGIIIILVAIALVGFYAYPKMKALMGSPPPPETQSTTPKEAPI